MMETIELHLKLTLFDGIDPTDVGRLLERGRERRLAAKETLFAEGENATALYIIEEGILAVRKRLTGGSRGPSIHRLGPGTLIGEIPFFDRRDRTATVTAIEPSVLREIPYDVVERFARGQPEAGVLLMRNMGSILARRFRLLDEEIREEIIWGMESSGSFPTVT